MATSDVDQFVLGKLAKSIPPSKLATSLYQLLGLSVMLSKSVSLARKKRKLDTTRDTKSLALYQRIIWLANQGLHILKTGVLPFTDPHSSRLPSADTAAALFTPPPGLGKDASPEVAIAKPELPVLAAKLHASFYHAFCLFHNNPQVRSVWPRASTDDIAQLLGHSEDLAAAELAAVMGSHTSSTPGPQENPAAPLSPPLSPASSLQSIANACLDGNRESRSREPIPSIASESSYVTNPFANVPPGRPFSEADLGPEEAKFLASLNRNLAANGSSPAQKENPVDRQNANTPLERFQTPANCLARNSGVSASDFILRSENFIPKATTIFEHASKLACEKLAPSHPLRLSAALEHAAFMWDILHDFDGAKLLAKRAIQLVSKDDQPLTDADFEMAALMVTLLGNLRRRETPHSIISSVDRNSSESNQPHFNQQALDNLNGVVSKSDRHEPRADSKHGRSSQPPVHAAAAAVAAPSLDNDRGPLTPSLTRHSPRDAMTAGSKSSTPRLRRTNAGNSLEKLPTSRTNSPLARTPRADHPMATRDQGGRAPKSSPLAVSPAATITPGAFAEMSAAQPPFEPSVPLQSPFSYDPGATRKHKPPPHQNGSHQPSAHDTFVPPLAHAPPVHHQPSTHRRGPSQAASGHRREPSTKHSPLDPPPPSTASQALLSPSSPAKPGSARQQHRKQNQNPSPASARPSAQPAATAAPSQDVREQNRHRPHPPAHPPTTHRYYHGQRVAEPASPGQPRPPPRSSPVATKSRPSPVTRPRTAGSAPLSPAPVIPLPQMPRAPPLPIIPSLPVGSDSVPPRSSHSPLIVRSPAPPLTPKS